jgi:hypothetical protein
MDHFYLWCLGVHQGQVPETRFTVAPDDNELSEWSAHLHREHILPSLATAAAVPASVEDTADLLRSIAARKSRSTKEAQNQNKIQREQLDFIKEKEAKKKNKAEKWHATSRRLVLNAASTDSDSPADDISMSYLAIIISDTAGMADKELQSQMAGLGHSDAGFALELAASLYAGDIKWNNRTTPSNLSPFTVFELDPLSAMQSQRCMQLHILSKNTEGKLLEEIKASQIQEVKVPKTFKELHQVLLFYSGITTILFSTRSALAEGVKSFASTIMTMKIIFKGQTTADGNLPAKIQYAMEIRSQRWFGECKKYEDLLMVNDRLVCFNEVFEMVMNCTLNVTLPPNFIKSPPKNPTVTPHGAEDKDGKGRGKGKKRKRGDGDEDRIIKNTAPITEFLMKEGKIWKRDFAGKCSQDRPKWGDK